MAGWWRVTRGASWKEESGGRVDGIGDGYSRR